MKITIGNLKRLLQENINDLQNSDHIADIVHAAATAVKNDIVQRPIKPSDGIWRFDKIIDSVIDPNVERQPRFWENVMIAASRLNAGKDTWDPEGYGIVASYANTKTAYSQLGFRKARRVSDTDW